MRSNRALRATGSAFIPLFAVVSLACSGDTSGPATIDRLPRQLTVAEQAVIRSSNAFGFDLLDRVRALESGPNVFLSPVSAAMALGMTMNGTAGATWESMRDVLRLPALSSSEINESFRGLLDLLVNLDPRVTLLVGNSVWARDDVAFKQSFFNTVQSYFDAEARSVDFADPATMAAINGWARDATNGRIDKVIDRIDPLLIMFLLNAVYFKGTWERQFDPDLTRPAPFHREDGSTVAVQTMVLDETRLPFAWNQEYQAVELAYGGKAWAMVIVLPGEGRTLRDLVASLDAEKWDAIVADLDSTDVVVRMPRFRLAYDRMLNRPLIDLGMAVAFSEDADFTPLTPLAETRTVCIHFVKQNSFVEVNEEGTEAAAVTTVGVGTDSAPPSFTVDRPFLFVIRERLSGTILFAGAIGDPTVEKQTDDTSPTQCPPLSSLTQSR